MGSYLEKPVLEKERFSGEDNNVRVSVSAMQGWRTTMEDNHIAMLTLDEIPGFGLYAIFDGHGGSFSSTYAADNFIPIFLKYINIKTEPSNYPTQFTNIFYELDESLRLQDTICKGDDISGSTANVILLTPKYIVCANCGDSRSVLYSDKRSIALSTDHKPMNEEEKTRISEAGGCVILNRVNGSLAVSRSIGDFSLKTRADLGPEFQLVTAKPEVQLVERSEKDEFIIMACDGIWDVMTNESACQFISQEFKQQKSLIDITNNLLDKCLALDSKDNMSAIIIEFKENSIINIPY